jgi:hypothetical protein
MYSLLTYSSLPWYHSLHPLSSQVEYMVGQDKDKRYGMASERHCASWARLCGSSPSHLPLTLQARQQRLLSDLAGGRAASETNNKTSKQVESSPASPSPSQPPSSPNNNKQSNTKTIVSTSVYMGLPEQDATIHHDGQPQVKAVRVRVVSWSRRWRRKYRNSTPFDREVACLTTIQQNATWFHFLRRTGGIPRILNAKTVLAISGIKLQYGFDNSRTVRRRKEKSIKPQKFSQDPVTALGWDWDQVGSLVESDVCWKITDRCFITK